MGVNRFVGRNRGSRRYSRTTGKRKYAGNKRLKRLARRARFRRSAVAQSRQIRKLAGSLADTKGTKRPRYDIRDHFPSAKRWLGESSDLSRDSQMTIDNPMGGTLRGHNRGTLRGLVRRGADRFARNYARGLFARQTGLPEWVGDFLMRNPFPHDEL